MKKCLFILILGLTGCWSTAEEINYPALPDGLKDCKFYFITKGPRQINVVRCPNSQTTANYRAGKISQTVAVIEQ